MKIFRTQDEFFLRLLFYIEYANVYIKCDTSNEKCIKINKTNNEIYINKNGINLINNDRLQKI